MSFDYGVDPDGNVLVVWVNKSENILKSTTLPVGSQTWTTPVAVTPLHDGASNQEIVLIQGGTALVTFQDPLQVFKSIMGFSLFSPGQKAHDRVSDEPLLR